ncbi:MAG: nucleotide sugar dehydrogenase, partial [Candidatus Kariarchaeaceae archaeon]
VSILKEMNYILIDVQTPTDENHIPQYASLREVSKQVGENLSRGTVVIIESTCAPGTTEYTVKPIIEETSGLKCEKDFFLAFAYERVMVGRLIYNILNYPRIIGGIGEESAEKASWLYKHVLKNRIIQTTAMTAELAKVVENTYRDVNIAFANEVALVAESLGADVHEIRKLVNNLPFIEGKGNPHRNMHIPGAGVGGHCLVKDPWLLKYGLTQHGKKSVDLKVIEASRYRNIEMPRHTVGLLEDCLDETQKGKPTEVKVAVLGVAFIEDSDDPRNTPTKDIVQILKAKNYDIAIHDPFVRQNDFEFSFSHDLEEVLRDSDAVIIITAHEVYRKLNLDYLRSLMKSQPILIDGRITFDPLQVLNHGFKYRGLGRGYSNNKN